MYSAPKKAKKYFFGALYSTRNSDDVVESEGVITDDVFACGLDDTFSPFTELRYIGPFVLFRGVI